MTTLSESGEVLNQGYLRMSVDMGIPYEQITPELYLGWKTAQFARAYGVGPQGILNILKTREASMREQAYWEQKEKERKQRADTREGKDTAHINKLLGGLLRKAGV